MKSSTPCAHTPRHQAFASSKSNPEEEGVVIAASSPPTPADDNSPLLSVRIGIDGAKHSPVPIHQATPATPRLVVEFSPRGSGDDKEGNYSPYKPAPMSVNPPLHFPPGLSPPLETVESGNTCASPIPPLFHVEAFAERHEEPEPYHTTTSSAIPPSGPVLYGRDILVIDVQKVFKETSPKNPSEINFVGIDESKSSSDAIFNKQLAGNTATSSVPMFADKISIIPPIGDAIWKSVAFERHGFLGFEFEPVDVSEHLTTNQQNLSIECHGDLPSVVVLLEPGVLHLLSGKTAIGGSVNALIPLDVVQVTHFQSFTDRESSWSFEGVIGIALPPPPGLLSVHAKFIPIAVFGNENGKTHSPGMAPPEISVESRIPKELDGDHSIASLPATQSNHLDVSERIEETGSDPERCQELDLTCLHGDTIKQSSYPLNAALIPQFHRSADFHNEASRIHEKSNILTPMLGSICQTTKLIPKPAKTLTSINVSNLHCSTAQSASLLFATSSPNEDGVEKGVKAFLVHKNEILNEVHDPMFPPSSATSLENGHMAEKTGRELFGNQVVSSHSLGEFVGQTIESSAQTHFKSEFKDAPFARKVGSSGIGEKNMSSDLPNVSISADCNVNRTPCDVVPGLDSPVFPDITSSNFNKRKFQGLPRGNESGGVNNEDWKFQMLIHRMSVRTPTSDVLSNAEVVEVPRGDSSDGSISDDGCSDDTELMDTSNQSLPKRLSKYPYDRFWKPSDLSQKTVAALTEKWMARLENRLANEAYLPVPVPEHRDQAAKSPTKRRASQTVDFSNNVSPAKTSRLTPLNMRSLLDSVSAEEEFVFGEAKATKFWDEYHNGEKLLNAIWSGAFPVDDPILNAYGLSVADILSLKPSITRIGKEQSYLTEKVVKSAFRLLLETCDEHPKYMQPYVFHNEFYQAMKSGHGPPSYLDVCDLVTGIDVHFWPIFDGKLWMLLIVDLKGKEYFLLSPASTLPDPDLIQPALHFYKNLGGVNKSLSRAARSWKLKSRRNHPKTDELCNSAAFVIQFAMSITQREQSMHFCEDTMSEFRRTIGIQLLNRPKPLLQEHICLTMSDVESTFGNETIVDNVIVIYLKLLQRRSDKCSGYLKFHLVEPFLFEWIRSDGEDIDEVCRQIDLKKTLMFPIGDGVHWKLYIINEPESKISIYDSLDSENDKHVHVVQRWLNEERNRRNLPLRPWTIHIPRDVPKQKYGQNSCALFVMAFAEALSRNLEPTIVNVCRFSIRRQLRRGKVPVGGFL